MEFTIKIDSREQLPYVFDIPSVVGKLDTGDYSVKGLEGCVAVERKSLDDLIGSITTGRERFKKELQRGKGLDYFALVVEGTLQDIAEHRYRSKMLPKAAIQSLIAFSVRYRLPVFFVENRAYGQRITESLLTKYAREIEMKAKLMEQSNG